MCDKNVGGSIRDIMQYNRKLYIALSELFIDNEVDYHYIAAEVKSYPLEQVKKALFYDVAPVCYFNLMTPIPPVWAGFNEKWLLLEIMRIKHQQKTVIGRIKLFWLSIYLRSKFKDELQRLEELL